MEVKLSYQEAQDLAAQMRTCLAYGKGQIDGYKESLVRLTKREKWLVEHQESDASLSSLVSSDFIDAIGTWLGGRPTEDPVVLDISARYHGDTTEHPSGLFELDPGIKIGETPFRVHSVQRLAGETKLVTVAIWVKRDTGRAVTLPADTHLSEVLDDVRSEIASHDKMIVEVEARNATEQRKLDNANKQVEAYELGLDQHILGSSAVVSTKSADENELAVAHGMVKKQKKTIRALQRYKGRPTREVLIEIIDETRKKNGVVNYAKVGERVGRSGTTAKAWIAEAGLERYALQSGIEDESLAERLKEADQRGID